MLSMSINFYHLTVIDVWSVEIMQLCRLARIFLVGLRDENVYWDFSDEKSRRNWVKIFSRRGEQEKSRKIWKFPFERFSLASSLNDVEAETFSPPQTLKIHSMKKSSRWKTNSTTEADEVARAAVISFLTSQISIPLSQMLFALDSLIQTNKAPQCNSQLVSEPLWLALWVAPREIDSFIRSINVFDLVMALFFRSCAPKVTSSRLCSVYNRNTRTSLPMRRHKTQPQRIL